MNPFRKKISSLKHQFTIDNISDPIIILNFKNLIVDTNRAANVLFAHEKNDLINQPLEKILLLSPALEAALSSSTESTVEICLEQAKDSRYYNIRIAPLLSHDSSDGRVLYLTDITQYKLTIEQLTKRNQVLEVSDAFTKDITSTLDLQSILKSAAKFSVEYLGITSAYINLWNEVDKTTTVIAEYFSSEASEQERISDLGVVYNIEETFGNSAEWLKNMQAQITHVDDPEIPEKEQAHLEEYGAKTMWEIPLRAKGKEVGVLELWESRFKREYSEVELEAMQALAQPIALAINNATLYQEIVTASQNKTNLLAQVNHELRTPLSVIILFADMLKQNQFGPLSPEQTNAIGSISSNVEHLRRLVESLLVQAEIDMGKITVDDTPFSTQEIVENLSSQMKVLAEEKGLSFTFDIGPNVPDTIPYGRQQVWQILINLIGNGIKYTEEGSIEVCLYQPKTGFWAVQVKDTGNGIPIEAQQSIFEPFWRADSSNTEMFGGNGLGLSIVKQLTQMMGGDVSVKSEVGKGSTFTVIFPLSTEQSSRS